MLTLDYVHPLVFSEPEGCGKFLTEVGTVMGSSHRWSEPDGIKWEGFLPSLTQVSLSLNHNLEKNNVTFLSRNVL